MSSQAISKFLTDLAVHFPPKHARPELENSWLRSMADALRGYSPAILAEAARHIIDHRKYTTFPLPSECREACIAAARRQESQVRAETLPEFRSSMPFWASEERERLANDLIKSAMGKQAANEGWVLALWNFCLEHARIPTNQAEIGRCRREAKDLDEAYAMCLRGGWPEAKKWETFGSSMLAKREKLAAEVLGKPDISRTA